MCLYPQHQLISSNVKSKQPIVPAPSGFDMQSPQRWGPPGHDRTLEKTSPWIPMEIQLVFGLCVPQHQVPSSSRPQLQKHRHCSAVAVEIPARHFNFKAIKNPRGFFSEMTWLFLGDLLKQFHMVVCHPALERAKAGAGSLLTLLT